jgi:long-chain acyl-CoA synthetase
LAQHNEKTSGQPSTDEGRVFWRVEGSLLNLAAVRPVGFFTWNAQSFAERWGRRGLLAMSALVRPFLYATNRVFATRVLHTLLRGVSQDRLDLLGEEYFEYKLKPFLHQPGVDRLKALIASGREVILVSQGLDHVMRPLARHLGAKRLVANRLEFRDGLATGRLIDPVIRPRGGYARLIPLKKDGTVSAEKLASDLGFKRETGLLDRSVISTERNTRSVARSLVVFDKHKNVERLSVREALCGKNVLLIGVTGFIGKVWLVKILQDVPDIGKIYLLIRRSRSVTAHRRFEKIIESSPLFEPFHEKYGDQLAQFLSGKVEVIEGDITKPGLGVSEATIAQIAPKLDLIVNSAGLTDFNPDLRQALEINVDGTLHLLDFMRRAKNAAMMHLSTCYVAGHRDGRVPEIIYPDYTPAPVDSFDAAKERDRLCALVSEIIARSEGEEVTCELRAQVAAKANGKQAGEAALESQVRKSRARWVRDQMIEEGMRRAKSYGWPNTYTFTKSLAESLIARFGSDLPIAVVRPSIVETSTHDPFPGWNEGVNTSAPISYLLGTYFRQLPSNERKCLDLIPVDLVCRGMSLIAAALATRRHEPVYHLATSGVNPCDMRRSVELTGLAHRKHYRAQDHFKDRFRARFDSITVSKERYQRLSAPRQKAVVQAIQKMSAPLPLKKPPFTSFERGLDRVEKLIELYEPFILHNVHVFEAEKIELLNEALVAEERDRFGYDAAAIDWWEYWINIHIPALRKWSYPLIEGRPLEERPRRSFQLATTTRVGT